jgi:flagellar protein FlaH
MEAELGTQDATAAPAADLGAAHDGAAAALAEAREYASAPEEAQPEEEHPEEQQPRLIVMGVMDVDKKLGGGLPPESITLVEGDPESGKSVVVQQLTYNALVAGFTAAAFLSESTPREFLDQMQSLGMPTTDYYLVGRLALFHANLRVDQERAERIMRRFLNYVESDKSPELIVFDSVTPLLFQFDARYVLSFLATCKELAALGKTIIVTLHSYAINESLRLRADSIVDAHLRLRIEELGKQVVRTLEVAKIRGAVKTIGNSVSFTVEPGMGLKTVPISKTKA